MDIEVHNRGCLIQPLPASPAQLTSPFLGQTTPLGVIAGKSFGETLGEFFGQAAGEHAEESAGENSGENAGGHSGNTPGQYSGQTAAQYLGTSAARSFGQSTGLFSQANPQQPLPGAKQPSTTTQ